MGVVDSSFGHPMAIEEKATMPLAGGIANMGYQCGMLWGAALAAGAQAYQLHGAGPQAETAAVLASQRLVKSFHTYTKNEINCLEISDLNMQAEADFKSILKFFAKGGPISCFRMAARYAPDAYREIDCSLSEELIEVPTPPVSCASILARRMGVSELHVVMAAGFAGGIGFSGGACGALGAAIWITGMDRTTKPVGFSFSDTWIGDMIEQFLECTDYEFECAEIIGQKFESVGDHAAYLHNGGCSDIIEALAAFE